MLFVTHNPYKVVYLNNAYLDTCICPMVMIMMVMMSMLNPKNDIDDDDDDDGGVGAQPQDMQMVINGGDGNAEHQE